MSEKEKPSLEKYTIGQDVKYKSGDGEIFELKIADYNPDTKYYLLRGNIGGEIKNIRIPKNMMYEKLVSPEEENLKYPIGKWVSIYRNVYDSDGKKTGERKKTKGFVSGIARGDGSYMILCPISDYEEDFVLVAEKTLDELNPKDRDIDATMKFKHIRNTRDTLQGGFGAGEEKK